MNRAYLLPVLCLSLILSTVSHAASELSKDAKNLEREAAQLDKTAATPAGEAAVVARITKEFGIDAGRIRALRAGGEAYGEMVAVLSLAQSLPGGTSETNVAQIKALRTGPPPAGWDSVAAQTKAKLGKTVSKIKKLNNDARRLLKQPVPAAAAPPKEPMPAAGASPSPSKKYIGEGKSLPQGHAAD